MNWPATERAALGRLEAFLPHAAGDYARQRNFDFGADDRSNVSALSPWIRHGVLSESAVLARVLAVNNEKSAEKFIQEVLWRGYFKGWLEHRPGVWDGYCADRDAGLGALAQNTGVREGYGAAVDGRTGIEAFDHWARELIETGYLHNHARMWFASIWIFTLNLPWALGADFFFRHLLDGDPASNTCSWRWVAGLHTPGKHYIARADNIAKFTADRFDPEGQLNETADPVEFENINPDPEFPDLPMTAEPRGRAGWLLTPDSPSDQAISEHVPVLGLALPDLRSPLEMGDLARSLEIDALKLRCGHSGIVALPESVDQSTQRVTQWVCDEALETVCLPYIAAGPYGDLAPRLIAAIRAAGAEPLIVTRRYDRAVWPFAAKGFFKLKSKIPSILRQLELA